MRNVLAENTNREKLEFSLVHRISADLQAGVEYGADSNELFPMVNYRLLSATESTPAIILGTSSAWPSGEVDGNAFFISTASMLSDRSSGSLSLSYTPDDESWKIPASYRYVISDQIDGTLIWDGEDLHPLLTWRGSKINLSLILLSGEDLTLSTTVNF
ncbi:hypothetical protein OAP77_00420 [Planctomycetota bacterium]|nr:hypothetical protein [Planctomycetota bacterium]MDC3251567.1 hypothetical protein [Planctomycetota bacterium]|tara:strand:+ start:513 stop:989 length:477 start_codon:yes stop_codon:yes gene_type:complete